MLLVCGTKLQLSALFTDGHMYLVFSFTCHKFSDCSFIMPAACLLQPLNSLTVYFILKLCDDISVDFTTSIEGIAVGSAYSHY